MADALEAEGLNITWPKVLNSDSDLAIEGRFNTGCDREKLVFIDLNNEGDLSTKKKVDAAIWNQLDLAYDNFSIDDEMEFNMGVNGAPSAKELLEDMEEQERRLKRFSEVARAVAEGRDIPEEEDTAEITISGADAKRIAVLLVQVGDYKHTYTFSDKEKAFANQMADELANKIKAA